MRQFRAHLTLRSKNVKTGPIPVSTTEKDTCPPTCGMYNECYAKYGPLIKHWASLKTRGLEWLAFCLLITRLPLLQLWRHNQAGDLPGDGKKIDAEALSHLVRSNAGRRGFTYTHYLLTRHNAKLIEWANDNGFTVNVSCDSLAEVDEKAKTVRAPLVVVLPSGTKEKVLRTPEGRKVVVCHAPHNGVTCAVCAACQSRHPNRAVIGFPAHGVKKKVIDLKLKGIE